MRAAKEFGAEHGTTLTKGVITGAAGALGARIVKEGFKHLSLDPPRKSGWSFSGAGLGGLILSVAVGVVFRPLTFVRLVHRFLPGMLAAVAAWAVGVW
jgi:hypothetical protein